MNLLTTHDHDLFEDVVEWLLANVPEGSGPRHAPFRDVPGGDLVGVAARAGDTCLVRTTQDEPWTCPVLDVGDGHELYFRVSRAALFGRLGLTDIGVSP